MTTQYDADVIVIGSGALGSNAAYELAKQGRSVIMLEAGSRVPRWKILENFRSSSRKANFNDPYPNEPWAYTSYNKDYIENVGSFNFRPGMLKLVGGTTWHWAAACWRYLPNDMKLNTLYGVGRDWPIEYDVLEPYYLRAERALGVAGNGEEDQSGQNGKPWPPRSAPYPLPPDATTYMNQRLNVRLKDAGYHYIHEPNGRVTKPYDGRPACCGNNNCMPVCPIGAMYSGNMHADHAEKAGVKLLTEATAYKLEKGAGGKIVAVHYRKPDGTDQRLTARYFVVAANGLETPKLLLISEVANSSDQVGRNLMDHTGISLSLIGDEDLWPGRGAVQQGGIFNWRDGDFRKRHSAVKHSMSNAVANRGVTERLLRMGVVGKELDDRIVHDAARWIDVGTVFEALPEAGNRITPAAKKDALGIPMMRVHYDVSDYMKAGAEVAKQDYVKFTKLFNAEVVQDDSGWENRDHLMGSVIMGSDPKNSVVNGDCRTHDHDNLFLATTGVIPASGVINPTLTGVALSIRIADTIGKEI